MTKYGVAFYKDGVYQGTVASHANIKTWDEASVIAERWRKAHANKHDYRPVAFDARGYLIRECH